MKINEITLIETPVMSSWISDLTLQNNQRDVTMSLGNGNKYRVAGVGAPLYNNWMKASSKGTFWHDQIKGNFIVTRIM